MSTFAQNLQIESRVTHESGQIHFLAVVRFSSGGLFQVACQEVRGQQIRQVVHLLEPSAGSAVRPAQQPRGPSGSGRNPSTAQAGVPSPRLRQERDEKQPQQSQRGARCAHFQGVRQSDDRHSQGEACWREGFLLE